MFLVWGLLVILIIKKTKNSYKVEASLIGKATEAGKGRLYIT